MEVDSHSTKNNSNDENNFNHKNLSLQTPLQQTHQIKKLLIIFLAVLLPGSFSIFKYLADCRLVDAEDCCEFITILVAGYLFILSNPRVESEL